MTPQTILDFWFKEHSESDWWVKNTDFDTEIRTKFLKVYEKAAAGKCSGWCDTVDGCLAFILVLDQFPRNMFRDSSQSFETDATALKASQLALKRGYDLALKAEERHNERAFMYIPFMHSENLEDQRRCIDLFETHGPEANILFARKHHDIIARFGRFPHRNKILGRTSTEDETLFLQQAGSAF